MDLEQSTSAENISMLEENEDVSLSLEEDKYLHSGPNQLASRSVLSSKDSKSHRRYIQRRDSITDNAGYMYIVNKKSRSGKQYLRCTNYPRGCTARALLTEDGTVVTTSSPSHCHPVDRRRLAIRRFVYAVIEEMRKDEGVSLHDAFNLVKERNPEESVYVTLKNVARSVKNAQAAGFFETPIPPVQDQNITAVFGKKKSANYENNLKNDGDSSVKTQDGTEEIEGDFEDVDHVTDLSGNPDLPWEQQLQLLGGFYDDQSGADKSLNVSTNCPAIPKKYRTVVDDDGYTYTINRRRLNRGVMYLRCTQYTHGCSAKGVIRGKRRPDTSGSPAHNHPVDYRRLAIRRFTEAVVKEALHHQGRSVSQIFNQLVELYPEDAMHVSYRNVVRALRKAQLEEALRPSPPLDPDELSECEWSQEDRTPSKEERPPTPPEVYGDVNSANQEGPSNVNTKGKITVSESATASVKKNINKRRQHRRKRSTILDKKGFQYQVNQTRGQVQYVRCSQWGKGCRARGIIRGGILETSRLPGHSHPVPLRCRALQMLVSLMETESREPRGRSLKQIYRELIEKHPNEAALVSYQSVSRAIKRAQLAALAPSPPSVEKEKPSLKRNTLARKNKSSYNSKYRLSSSEELDSKSNEDRTELNAFSSSPLEISPSRNYQEMVDNIKDEIKAEIETDTQESYMDEVEYESYPSELLPGPKGQPLYYDGVGYYYNPTSEDESFRWLQCSYAGCAVLAQMALSECAPITVLNSSNAHSHPPNSARRERITFLHRIKLSLSSEKRPFAQIFQREAERNPIGASFFSIEKIEKHLKKRISGSDTATTSADSSRVMGKSSAQNSLDEPETKKRKTDELPNTEMGVNKKLRLLEMQDSPEHNKKPDDSSRKILYHDGAGFFYHTIAFSSSSRSLQCANSGCPALAVMDLPKDSPIMLAAGSLDHNHRPSQNVVSPQKLIENTGFCQDITDIRTIANENEEVNCSNTVGDIEDNIFLPKRSEKIEGPEFFHDLKGNFYYSTHVKDGDRYLRCLVPTCPAEACMAHRKGAEIRPVPSSRPHNHLPDTTDPALQFKQWEEQWGAAVPSERLPSLRLQYCCYHDRRGYYYCQTSLADDIRYLICIETSCPVRAHMTTKKDAPISISPLRPQHTHGADLGLRGALLFIDAARVRCRSDTLPEVAVAQETIRNPLGSERVDLKMLQQCLERASDISNTGNENISEDEVDFMACVRPLDEVPVNSSIENVQAVANHYTSPMPPEEFFKREAQKAELRSERVPEVVTDHWLIHDGNGHYYASCGVHQQRRWLQCVVPHCGSRAWQQIYPGAPVRSLSPHQHLPQTPQYRTELCFLQRIKSKLKENPKESISKIYNEQASLDPEGASLVPVEEAQQIMDQIIPLSSTTQDEASVDPDTKTRKLMVPVTSSSLSERLPGVNGDIFYDGEGHYYQLNSAGLTPELLQLECVNKSCGGQATRGPEEGSPLTITKCHSHEADPKHRELLLLSHSLRSRVRDEPTSLAMIFTEEAAKFPEGAKMLLKSKVMKKLENIRKYVKSEMDVQAELDDLDDEEISSLQQVDQQWEELPGRFKSIYHNGLNYYYVETFTSNTQRWLMCVEQHCVAQAVISLKPGVAPRPFPHRHSHPADPLRGSCFLFLDTLRQRARCQTDRDLETIYTEEAVKEPIIAGQIPKKNIIRILDQIRHAEERGVDTRISQDNEDNEIEEKDLWETGKPAERLFCGRIWLFHDGHGFYYYCTHMDVSTNRKILHCREEGCSAVAFIEKWPGACVTRAAGSPLHTHRPNLARRAHTVLLNRVLARARSEHCSLETIYEEESRKDPENAALFPNNKLKSILERLNVIKYFEKPDCDERTTEESSNRLLRDYEGSEETQPCEILHSANTAELVYHDSNGLYYRQLRQTFDKMLLVCLKPSCTALAYLHLNDMSTLHCLRAPAHCHDPDVFYGHKLTFLHRLRTRATSEHNHTTITTIYTEEATREPIGADVTNEIPVKNWMFKLGKLKSIEDNSEMYPVYGPDTAIPDIDNMFSTSDDLEELIDSLQEEKDPEVFENCQCDDEYTEEEFLEEALEPGKLSEEELVPSEKLPCHNCQALYHDGKGYYYHLNSTKDSIMILSCAQPGCGVHATLSTEVDNAPIRLARSSTRHNHDADLSRRRRLLLLYRCKRRAASESTPLTQIWQSEVARDPVTASQLSASHTLQQMKEYRTERESNPNFNLVSTEELVENMHTAIVQEDEPIPEESSIEFLEDEYVEVTQSVVPEKVPSLVFGESLWHSAGFLYTITSSSGNIRKVRCVEKGCRALGQIQVKEGAAQSLHLISGSKHNHPPNRSRRDQLVFIDRCKRRAITSKQSIDSIYEYEKSKEPEVASNLDANRIKQAMKIARKSSMPSNSYKHEESEGIETVECSSECVLSEETGNILYHDGRGYLFSELGMSATQRVLMCVDCAVRAKMALRPPNAPIRLDINIWHVHEPDLDRLDSLGLHIKSSLKSPQPQMQLSTEYESDHKLSDSEVEQSYSDYVTLEDNTDDQEVTASEKVQGWRPNTSNFHDGKGYYYNSYTLTDTHRYLSCVNKGCRARAFMVLEPEDAPIRLTRQSESHNHMADPGYKQLINFTEKCKRRAIDETTSVHQIYEEERARDPASSKKILKEHLIARMFRARSIRIGMMPFNRGSISDDLSQYTTKLSDDSEYSGVDIDCEDNEVSEKSEALPGYRPNSTVYHDCAGHFYVFSALRENKRHMRCIEPKCPVRAVMQVAPATPIHTSRKVQHTHKPDHRKRTFLLFLQRCKNRAINESKPVQQIYNEEANKDSVSASMISSHNLIQRMTRARSTHLRNNPHLEEANNESSEPDVFQDSEMEEIDRALTEMAKSNLPFDIKEGGPVPEDQLEPSEKLPSLRPNMSMMHDGRGYYYMVNHERDFVLYLSCIEAKCRVRAHMESIEGSPIIQTPTSLHNHPPDLRRREFTLWLDRCKRRAIDEPTLTIATIYHEEAEREPDSAMLISEENMRYRMHLARKAITSKIPLKPPVKKESLPKKMTPKLEPNVAHKKNPLSNVLTALVKYLSPPKGVTKEHSNQSESGENQPMVMVTDSDHSQDEEGGFITLHQAKKTEDGNSVYVYQPPGTSNMPKRQPFTDNKGYCYQQTTIRGSTRYLKCAEQECRARASMHLNDNAAISLSRQSPMHNHEPGQSDFAMVLDSGEVLSGDNQLQVIYTDEDGREQVALCQIADGPKSLNALKSPRSTSTTKRPYKPRIKPDLTINVDEFFDASAVDLPEIEVDENGEYYRVDDQQQTPLKPSEIVPGLRPDANNYHDGNGYYYEVNRLSQNIRYLKCLMKDCKARAYMEVGKKGAPIIQTNFAKHNHGPDLFRKQFTVFLHRCARRAAVETTPINIIYHQEAERDPTSASQIRMENVKQRMVRYRKKHGKNRTPINYEQEMMEQELHFVEGGDETEEAEQDGVGGDEVMYYLVDPEGEEGEFEYYLTEDGSGEGFDNEEVQVELDEGVQIQGESALQGFVLNEVEIDESGQV